MLLSLLSNIFKDKRFMFQSMQLPNELICPCGRLIIYQKLCRKIDCPRIYHFLKENKPYVVSKDRFHEINYFTV